jgi:hypothetical protein
MNPNNIQTKKFSFSCMVACKNAADGRGKFVTVTAVVLNEMSKDQRSGVGIVKY